MARQFSLAFSTAFEFAPSVQDITDTDILQLPVDVVLAGQQPYEFRYREYEIRSASPRARVKVIATSSRRLGGAAPSFETKIGKRGYD